MKLGSHVLHESDVRVLLPHGCPKCDSREWLRFEHTEVKYSLGLNEDGELADWYDQDGVVYEVNDPIEIDCSECWAILWTDDEGWIEEMATVLREEASDDNL